VTCRNIVSELLGGAGVQRVGGPFRARHPNRGRFHRFLRRLRATDGHHEQFVRANQRHRWPCAHCGTDEAVAQAVRDVCRERGRYAQAEQPARERRHAHSSAR
jgi:hypothetical protein